MSFSDQLWATLQAGMPVFLWLIISAHLACMNRRAFTILLLAIVTIWLWQFQRVVFTFDPAMSQLLPLIDILIIFSALLFLPAIWQFATKPASTKNRVLTPPKVSLGCVLFLCLLGMLFSTHWWSMWFIATPELITWNGHHFRQVLFWCAQLLGIGIYALSYWMIRQRYFAHIVRIVRVLIVMIAAELLTQLYELVLFIPSIDGFWRADWAIVYESNPWHWWIPFLEHFGGFRLQSDWIHTFALLLYYSVVIWCYMPKRRSRATKSRRRLY